MAKAKKGYDFLEVEARIKKFWDEEKIYAFDIRKKPVYAIDTPPPTVSGAMHIGHSFSYAQQDFIARFRRMNGEVFYPFGTDDNGLPTERLVEKLKKVKSKKMSRADFIALCLKTLEEITPEFVDDWKKLGISADYDICYSTIDDHSRLISQKAFLQLFKKGEVYKHGFPTIWCPECQTAIAQAELEDKEKTSKFVFIKAEVKGLDPIVFATTRPELMHACVCISVHKDDERYKDYVGKMATIPLTNVEVPIITDEFAKMDFGTGAVYWCPYGDKHDVGFMARHPEFTPIIVLNPDGTLNEKTGKYKGLKIKDAREQLIKDLEKAKAVDKVEMIQNVANAHDKCGTEIEFLPVEQWFIKVMDKKDALIKRGKRIRWYPAHMQKRFDNWVNGLEWDWNISRNRHFGIPIPTWECKVCNKIIPANESELPVDPLQKEKKCPDCKKLAEPETMVLDTWATSSLTPYLASFLVNGKVKIPYSLRPQGHDIIRTWAFYTICRAHLEHDTIPWEDIMISGMVTRKGEKMSKSKGNSISPQEVMETYGADALRFWAAGSKLGGDLDYQEQDLIAGKKTVTKLVNATKFVFMNLEGYDGKKRPEKLELLDEEFLKKLNLLVDHCTKAFLKYEYSKAKLELEKFFWSYFCDNYLEIVKKRVYQGTGDAKLSAQYTLHKVLFTLLKLFAPIMPFITEELYQTYFKEHEKYNSIHRSAWPKVEGHVGSVQFDNFVIELAKVRQAKTEMKKAMNAPIKEIIFKGGYLFPPEMEQDFLHVSGAATFKTGKEYKVVFKE